jgi:acetyl esterase/lipase
MQLKLSILAACLATTTFWTTTWAADMPHVASVLEAPVSAAQPAVRTGFSNLYYENAQQRYGDLIYAQGSDTQKMDLYLPAHAKKPYPVILAIHGGAWATGDKATGEVNPEMEALKYGFAVASINYRLSSEASFPAPLQDCKAAVRFLKAQSKKYKLNDNKIVAWGDSAGGNLAALLGTTAKVKNLEDKALGSPKENSSVAAVVAFFPAVSLSNYPALLRQNGIKSRFSDAESELYASKYIGGRYDPQSPKLKAVNPLTYLTNDAPPFFIMNGDKDDIVPTQESKLLADTLASAIGPKNVAYYVIRGGSHGGPAFENSSNLAKVFAFLHDQIGTPGEMIKAKGKR